MKKKMSALSLLLLILIIGGTVALAAGNPLTNTDTGENVRFFVDEDEDGICDNRECKQGQSFVDEDEDGICDNQGKGQGNGFCQRGRNGNCGN